MQPSQYHNTWEFKLSDLSSSNSDANERPETENGTIYSHDSGFEGECHATLPASPTTIPRNRIGSTSRRERPRRQRTTSTSQNTIRPNEAIIRVSNNRTIYTAGICKLVDIWIGDVTLKVLSLTYRQTTMVQRDGAAGGAFCDRYLRWQCQWKDDRRSKDHRVSRRPLGHFVVHGLFL